jgi:hypothetical protein
MSGSDEVGVDPGRLSQAASALENLRDVLAANVPTIVSIMNEYWSSGAGSPISLAALQQAQQRSVEDAAGMRSRSNLAQAFMAEAVNIDLVVDGQAYIPWDLKTVDAEDAELQAQQLATAVNSGNRAQIQAVEQDLEDHQDDKQWLADFWSQPQAASSTANLANVLNRQDGKGLNLLSASDQQILSTYARSVAAACQLGGLNTQQASELTEAFTNAASAHPWSTAMLLKYGPDGSAYGTGTGANLLAGVTRSVLDARENGQLTIPINIEQIDNGQHSKDLDQAVQNYDPTLTMLELDTQNKIAATQVLGGPNGGTYAYDLLHTPWARYLESEGPNNAQFLQAVNPDPNSEPQGPDIWSLLLNQNIVGSFLDAATQGTDPGKAPPIGTSPLDREAATAAMNIIENTPSTGTIVLSNQVRQALLDTFGRYLPDLAASVNGTYQGPNGQVLPAYVDGKYDGPYIFELPDDNVALQTFLQQIATDSSDAAAMQAAVLTSFSRAFGVQMKYGPSSAPSSDLANDLASLYGEVDTAEKNLHYSAAQQEDARNAALNSLVSIAESSLAVIPSPTDAVAAAAWNLQGCALPLIPQFSTDNAANAAAQFDSDEALRKIMVAVPMAQGLIAAGIVKPEPEWYQDGKINLNTPAASAAFQSWWEAEKGHDVYQLPTLYSPPGRAVPQNDQNTQTLETLWYQYGQGMQLAYQKDGQW